MVIAKELCKPHGQNCVTKGNADETASLENKFKNLARYKNRAEKR